MKGGFVMHDGTKWFVPIPTDIELLDFKKTYKYLYSNEEKQALTLLIPNGLPYGVSMKQYWTDINDHIITFNMTTLMLIDKHLKEACKQRAENLETFNVYVEDFKNIDYKEERLKGQQIALEKKTSKASLTSVKSLHQPSLALNDKSESHLDYYFLLLNAREQINNRYKELNKQEPKPKPKPKPKPTLGYSRFAAESKTESQSSSKSESQSSSKSESQSSSKSESQSPSQDESQLPSQDESQLPSQDESQIPSQDESQIPSQSKRKNKKKSKRLKPHKISQEPGNSSPRQSKKSSRSKSRRRKKLSK